MRLTRPCLGEASILKDIRFRRFLWFLGSLLRFVSRCPLPRFHWERNCPNFSTRAAIGHLLGLFCWIPLLWASLDCMVFKNLEVVGISIQHRSPTM